MPAIGREISPPAIFKERIRLLDAQCSAAERAGAAPRLSQLLYTLSEQIRSALAASRCIILLVDKAHSELWSPVGGNGELVDIRLPIPTTQIGRVVETGKSLRTVGVPREPYLEGYFPEFAGNQLRSLLAVPFSSGGQASGVFLTVNSVDGAEFSENDEALLQILASSIGADIQNARLREELNRSQLETIFELARMAEFRDTEDTPAHLKNIRTYSKIIAYGFALPENQAEAIACAAPLHDVGKVAITDAVLKKNGPLSPEEYNEMKRHSRFGWEILRSSTSPILKLAADIALTHHERFDGTGYPQGLKGDAISVPSQIVALADVFDALTARRHYKHAWTLAEAVAYIKRASGTLFSPDAVGAFLRSYDELRSSYELRQTADSPSPPGG